MVRKVKKIERLLFNREIYKIYTDRIKLHIFMYYIFEYQKI